MARRDHAAQVRVRSDPPMTHRQAARRSAGCCFIHSASCGAPIRQDVIEMSTKSEVVTVCSRQVVGEERLQSTAMILITAGKTPASKGDVADCSEIVVKHHVSVWPCCVARWQRF